MRISLKQSSLVAVWLVLLSAPVRVQQAGRAEFDVVSIKPIPRDRPGPPPGVGGATIPPGERRFVATNVTPLMLIAVTDSTLRETQIAGGPDWIRNTAFDINATITGDLPRAELLKQMPALVRALLEERFRLRTHTESRPSPVFALVRARADGRLGPQLKPLPDAIDCVAIDKERATLSIAERQRVAFSGPLVCSQIVAAGSIRAGTMTMAGLAGALTNRVGRPVLDRTSLSGQFDFELRWMPERMTARDGVAAATTDANLPDIYTALQEQLGLKLESREEPRPFLVIDHIEQPTPD